MLLEEFKPAKVCTGCQKEKPLTAFYIRSGYNNPTQPGHWLSECKRCMKERSSTQRRSKDGESLVYSEQLAIEKLRSVGVFATAARFGIYPHADICAWGCVPIEVKYARLRLNHGQEIFTFNTTVQQQRRGFVGNIVMLVCEYPDGNLTYHLFESDDPVFYMGDRIKTGFTYVPGRVKALKHGNNRVVMTQGMMDASENNWQLIEKYRLQKSKQISLIIT